MPETLTTAHNIYLQRSRSTTLELPSTLPSSPESTITLVAFNTRTFSLPGTSTHLSFACPTLPYLVLHRVPHFPSGIEPSQRNNRLLIHQHSLESSAWLTYLHPLNGEVPCQGPSTISRPVAAETPLSELNGLQHRGSLQTSCPLVAHHKRRSRVLTRRQMGRAAVRLPLALVVITDWYTDLHDVHGDMRRRHGRILGLSSVV